jgi:uncharacterized membrane protein
MNQKLVSFIIAELILFSSVGMSYGVYVGFISGIAHVYEPITWSPTSFTIDVYPGTSKNQTITIHNSALESLSVSILASVNPDNGNVTVTLPFNTTTIPASSSKSFNATITAIAGATAGNYTITIAISRS